MLVFDETKTCIAKPVFLGSKILEFSCGQSAFVDPDELVTHCPFCHRPVNSLTQKEVPGEEALN